MKFVRMALIALLGMSFLCLFPLDIQAETLTEEEKLEHVEEIFQSLIDVHGNKLKRRPVLNWTTEAGRGAYYIPGTNEIYFESKAYTLCQKLGEDRLDNALAYILSHELIHYYRQHGWEAGFAAKFRGTEMAVEVNETIHDEMQAETESDLMGGFLAYMAGYNTVGIAEELLPILYDGYPWPKDSERYPSLNERIKIAKKTKYELINLIKIFETANYLVGIEWYKEARLFYEYILSEYQSRELLNNLGVIAVMEAMALFKKSDLKFGYPVELDGEARLKIGNTKGGAVGMGDAALKRDSLLELALRNFQYAIEQDPEYLPAKLNMACAYALRGLNLKGVDKDSTYWVKLREEYYDFAKLYSESLILRADRASKANTAASGKCLLGIVAVDQGDTTLAAQYFTAAQENSLLAEYNLQKMRTDQIEDSPNRKGAEMMGEFIDDGDFDLDSYTRRPVPDTMITIPNSGRIQWGVKEKSLENSYVYIFFKNRNKYAMFQVTEAGYTGETTQGIKIGDSIEKITANDMYKDPDKIINMPNGTMLVYAADQIMFFMDENHKVREWAVYRQKPEPE